MKAEQLFHLPILTEGYYKKPYPVHEIATVRQFGKEPIQLSVIGLYHYPGNNPLGAGNCELPMPDSTIDYLVYARDRSHYDKTGETWVIVPAGRLYTARAIVQVGQVTATNLHMLDTYCSRSVNIRPTKSPLVQRVRELLSQPRQKLATANGI